MVDSVDFGGENWTGGYMLGALIVEKWRAIGRVNELVMGIGEGGGSDKEANGEGVSSLGKKKNPGRRTCSSKTS